MAIRETAATVPLTLSLSGHAADAQQLATHLELVLAQPLRALSLCADWIELRQLDVTGATYDIVDETVIFANAASNAITITLPPASLDTVNREIYVKKSDATTNTVTVLARTAGNGGSPDSIDGNLSIILTLEGQTLHFVSDGVSKWRVLSMVAASGPGGALAVPATATPIIVNLTAGAVGTSVKYAREDHRHLLDVTISPTWTGVHTFTPSANAVPITVNGTVALTASMSRWSPYTGLDTIVTKDGDVGIGDETPTANLSMRARGVDQGEATIRALSPYSWWHASDIDGDGSMNNAYSNGAVLDFWKDKTPNGHDLTWNLAGRPTLQVNGGPNGTDSITHSTGGWAAWGGTAFGNPAGWTIFAVIQNTDTVEPIDSRFIVASAVGGGDVGAGASPGMIGFPNGNYGVTPRMPVFFSYRGASDGGGTSAYGHPKVRGTPTAWSPSWYANTWRYNGTHEAWIQGTVLANDAGNPAFGTGGFAVRSKWILLFHDGNSYDNGVIAAEVILFDRALSEGERIIVNDYLNQQYNPAATPSTARPLTHWKDVNGVVDSIVDTSLSWGLGTATPATKLHVIASTEQARVGYDLSNYFSITATSVGDVTLSAVGTAPILNLTGPASATQASALLQLYGSTAAFPGYLLMQAGDALSGNTAGADIDIFTGAGSGTGASGRFAVSTGNALGGDSGAFLFLTGAASTTSGDIDFRTGAATNSGNLTFTPGVASGGTQGKIGFQSTTAGRANFDLTLMTAARLFAFPDASGTLALTSAIPANIITGTGSGTVNTLPKFTAATVLGDSHISDTTMVRIGSASNAFGATFDTAALTADRLQTFTDIDGKICVSLGVTIPNSSFGFIMAESNDEVGRAYQTKLRYDVVANLATISTESAIEEIRFIYNVTSGSSIFKVGPSATSYLKIAQTTGQPGEVIFSVADPNVAVIPIYKFEGLVRTTIGLDLGAPGTAVNVPIRAWSISDAAITGFPLEDHVNRSAGNVFTIENTTLSRKLAACTWDGRWGFGYNSATIPQAAHILSFFQGDTDSPLGAPHLVGIMARITHNSVAQTASKLFGIVGIALTSTVAGAGLSSNFVAGVQGVALGGDDGNVYAAKVLAGVTGGYGRSGTLGTVAENTNFDFQAAASNRVVLGNWKHLTCFWADYIGYTAIAPYPTNVAAIGSSLRAPIQGWPAHSVIGTPFGEQWAIYGEHVANSSASNYPLTTGFMRVPYPRRTTGTGTNSKQIWWEPWPNIVGERANAIAGDTYFDSNVNFTGGLWEFSKVAGGAAAWNYLLSSPGVVAPGAGLIAVNGLVSVVPGVGPQVPAMATWVQINCADNIVRWVQAWV